MSLKGSIIDPALWLCEILSTVAANNCKQCSLSVSNNGRYCAGDGVVYKRLLPYQRR